MPLRKPTDAFYRLAAGFFPSVLKELTSGHPIEFQMVSVPGG